MRQNKWLLFNPKEKPVEVKTKNLPTPIVEVIKARQSDLANSSKMLYNRRTLPTSVVHVTSKGPIVAYRLDGELGIAERQSCSHNQIVKPYLEGEEIALLE